MKYTPTEEEINIARANAREILEEIFDTVSPYDVYLLRNLMKQRKIKEGYVVKKPEENNQQ